jgi:hypothetical protein
VLSDPFFEREPDLGRELAQTWRARDRERRGGGWRALRGVGTSW